MLTKLKDCKHCQTPMKRYPCGQIKCPKCRREASNKWWQRMKNDPEYRARDNARRRALWAKKKAGQAGK
jgi:hypothetical protein